MSLDAVPDGIDYEKVRQAISDVPGVKSVHHLHIWPLSTTVTAMTTHVIISDPLEMDNVINDIRKKMQSMGIKHSTIETPNIRPTSNMPRMMNTSVSIPAETYYKLI